MDNRSSELIDQLLAIANVKGIGRDELASRAGYVRADLDAHLASNAHSVDFVDKLAQAVGMRVGLEPASRPAKIQEFRGKHKSLVWSNSKAPDRTLLLHALLRSEFAVLLDAAVAFGVDTLRKEWATLLEESSPEVERVRERTEQILRNIEQGYWVAQAERE